VLLFDGASRDLGFAIDSFINTAFHGDETRVGLRHGEAANVLFADDHVVSVNQATQTGTQSGVSYRFWFEEPDGRQEYIWDFDR
jgi:prepilin-type processing-associated H-X9-DG protein